MVANRVIKAAVPWRRGGRRKCALSSEMPDVAYFSSIILSIVFDAAARRRGLSSYQW